MAALTFPTPTSLKNILDPTANSDAATKYYVDHVITSTAGGAAGTDGQLQFNTSNALGASANLTFNSANALLAVTGNISAVSLFLSGNVSSNITPNANGVLNLGANTQRFNDVFVAGNVDIAGQTISANATSVAISGNLVVANANIATLTTTTFVASTANIQDLTANTANVYSIKVLANLDASTGKFDILTSNSANVGNLVVSNFVGNVGNVNTIVVNNSLTINNNTQATSTTTGTFVTAGGVGIQKDLYVGGTIHLANNNGGTTSKGSINYNEDVSSIDFKFNG